MGGWGRDPRDAPLAHSGAVQVDMDSVLGQSCRRPKASCEDKSCVFLQGKDKIPKIEDGSIVLMLELREESFPLPSDHFESVWLWVKDGS